MNWRLGTYSGVEYNGMIWFSNNTFNGLFNMEVSTGVIKYVRPFPDEELMIVGCHKKCLAIDDRLFFIPCNGHNIHIYDINKDEFTSIPINNSGKEFCSDSIYIDGYIYIYPLYKDQELYKLSIDSLELQTVKAFRDGFANIVDSLNDIIICRVSNINSSTYFSFYGTSITASYDVKSESFSSYNIDVYNIFASYTNKDGCWIYTTVNGNLYLYDYKENTSLIYKDEKTDNYGPVYNRVFEFADGIWAIPRYSGDLVSVYDNMMIKKYNDYSTLEKDEVVLFSSTQVYDEMWLLPLGLADVFSITKDRKLDRKCSFELTDESSKKKYLSELMRDSGNPFLESTRIMLSDFLKGIGA